MIITKYYAQKSRGRSKFDKVKIKSKCGKPFYLTQRAYSYVERNPGISYLELFLSLSRAAGELVLPINHVINGTYRTIACRANMLRKSGHIKSEKEIASVEQEDLYSKINELHRGLKLIGKVPSTFVFKEDEIPLRNLGFKEMVNQSSLCLAISTPFLTYPRTTCGLMQMTGYKKRTINTIFTALHYLRLLERHGYRYSLTSKPEKRQDVLTLLTECQRNKEKHANHLRRCITAIEMLGDGESYKDVSLSTGYSIIHLMNIRSERPKFNSTTVEVLSSEELITRDEFEKLKKLELLLI